MELLLTHQTALSFWRNSLVLGAAALANRNTAPKCAPSRMPSFDAAFVRKLTLDDEPVHILISDPDSRGKRVGTICHVYSPKLPPSCICSIGHFDGFDIFVVSPELCFIQMCSRADYVDRLTLGCELCGTYRTRTASASGFATRYNVNRLATSSSLARAAILMDSTPNTSRATLACRHILDGSASPAETALALLLSIPNSKGGYGLPNPQLNPQQRMALPWNDLSSGDRADGAWRPHRDFRPDLYWPEHNVAVEYDSKEYHTQPEAMAHDAIRYNDLQDSKCTVFIATIGQLRSVQQSDRLAQQIARALGVRKRIRCKDFREKQARLRRSLGFS